MKNTVSYIKGQHIEKNLTYWKASWRSWLHILFTRDIIVTLLYRLQVTVSQHKSHHDREVKKRHLKKNENVGRTVLTQIEITECDLMIRCCALCSGTHSWRVFLSDAYGWQRNCWRLPHRYSVINRYHNSIPRYQQSPKPAKKSRVEATNLCLFPKQPLNCQEYGHWRGLPISFPRKLVVRISRALRCILPYIDRTQNVKISWTHWWIAMLNFHFRNSWVIVMTIKLPWTYASEKRRRKLVLQTWRKLGRLMTNLKSISSCSKKLGSIVIIRRLPLNLRIPKKFERGNYVCYAKRDPFHKNSIIPRTVAKILKGVPWIAFIKCSW